MANTLQRYSVFPGLTSISVESWYYPATPPNYIVIYFRNRRAFTFHEAEGYQWDVNEGEGVVIFSGWSPVIVREVAATAGRAIDLLRVFFFDSSPPLERPVYDGPAIDIPSPPGSFSLEEEFDNVDGVIESEMDADDERSRLGYDVVMLCTVRRTLLF